MAETLLDPSFLRRLERLELQTRRILSGQIKGDRRSKKRGISVDFADYRHYTRGDDLRFIDWNIYARLDRLFIKVFHEEQDLFCRILVDRSLSMDFGEPNKMQFAKQLAASIAYVGLKGQDKLTLSCFDSSMGDSFGPSRGRHHVRRMLGFLDGLEAEGGTSIAESCRDLMRKFNGKGIIVLISDFLDPGGFEPALRYLIRDGIDVYVIQVLAPEEINPTIGGHLELHDLETDEKLEITVNERLKTVYRRNVEAYCTQIQNFCKRFGFSYTLARTDMPMTDLMLRELRGKGLVKA